MSIDLLWHSDGMPAGVETVVITALAEESEAVVRALGSCAVRRWHGVDLHEASVRGGDVLVVPMSTSTKTKGSPPKDGCRR